MKVQSNNRSNNISVRIEEGCIPFSEICRVLSIDYMYAYNKVVKHLSQEIDVQRTVKNRKEPVSEDLEEAAWLYYDKNRLPVPPEWDLHKEFIDFFKAGAQWKEKEMQSTIELAEDHAMFAGMEKMKEQMMKDAIELEVKKDAGGYLYIDCIELYDYDKDEPLAKKGDKYKVILIKEE